MSTIDTHTLALVSVLGGLLMAASLGGVWIAGTRERAVTWWTFAGASLALGFLIGVLASGVPDPAWWHAALANAFVGAAHAAVFVGVRHHLGVRPWTLPAFAIVVLLFVAMASSVELQTSLRSRVLVQSVGYAMMDLWGGAMLWSRRAPGLTAYRRVVALVLLGHGAFFLARWLWVLVHLDYENSMGDDPFQMAVFPVGMVFAYALSVALVLMLYRGQELALRDAALRDALTGLPNRLALSEQVDREIARARRYGQPLSVVAFDVDHFKAINDAHGHPGGDDVLRAIANIVRTTIRDCDMAFRIGGEEFLVLLPCTRGEEARATAERLRSAVEARATDLGSARVVATISLGVTELQAGEAWAETVRRVDAALYEAKHAGRNRAVARLPRAPG
jgi:diguanylate cyclase (GGDEF)-like protein